MISVFLSDSDRWYSLFTGWRNNRNRKREVYRFLIFRILTGFYHLIFFTLLFSRTHPLAFSFLKNHEKKQQQQQQLMKKLRRLNFFEHCHFTLLYGFPCSRYFVWIKGNWFDYELSWDIWLIVKHRPVSVSPL